MVFALPSRVSYTLGTVHSWYRLLLAPSIVEILSHVRGCLQLDFLYGLRETSSSGCIPGKLGISHDSFAFKLRVQI